MVWGYEVQGMLSMSHLPLVGQGGTENYISLTCLQPGFRMWLGFCQADRLASDLESISKVEVIPLACFGFFLLASKIMEMGGFLQTSQFTFSSFPSLWGSFTNSCVTDHSYHAGLELIALVVASEAVSSLVDEMYIVIPRHSV